MTSTGRVLGDLITKTLVIDEGASFKGNCTMEVAGEEKMIAPANMDSAPMAQAQAAAALEEQEEQEEPPKQNHGKEQRSGRNKKDEGRSRRETDSQEEDA